MSRISQYPISSTLTDVKVLGNQAGVTKQIPATLFEPVSTIKRYKALLTQTGTAAPTAVVLENTIGQVPTFARATDGIYTINITVSLFTTNKTAVSIENGYTPGGFATSNIWQTSESEITFSTGVADRGTFGDVLLLNTLITIEVYP